MKVVEFLWTTSNPSDVTLMVGIELPALEPDRFVDIYGISIDVKYLKKFNCFKGGIMSPIREVPSKWEMRERIMSEINIVLDSLYGPDEDVKEKLKVDLSILVKKQIEADED
jgi:hypothetical protein